jgi:BlaI family penicillinase repressor
MARTPRDVTDAELGVLRILWERGPCSVRQIVDAYEETDRQTQAATVQKLLERLEAKEMVERDRSEPVQRFKAVADRDELIGRRLQGIASELCEGSLTPLISHLVKRERLTPADRQVLLDLIEQSEEEPPS